MSESDLPRAGEERLARPLHDAATADTAPVERGHDARATPTEDGSLQAPDERPISAYVQPAATTNNSSIAASMHTDSPRTDGVEERRGGRPARDDGRVAGLDGPHEGRVTTFVPNGASTETPLSDTEAVAPSSSPGGIDDGRGESGISDVTMPSPLVADLDTGEPTPVQEEGDAAGALPAHDHTTEVFAPRDEGGHQVVGEIEAPAAVALPRVAVPPATASPGPRPSRRMSDALRAILPALPILAILLIGGALRIYGYNWDEGSGLHPDERAIGQHLATLGWPQSLAEFFSPASPLNPHFAAYGHLPFYATVLFAHFLAFLGYHLGGPFAPLIGADVPNSPGITQSGRVLSALFDTGVLLFLYLIGRLVFSRSVGLLAALLGCFTVLDLEFSHFANVDTFLTFFVAGALYFCVRIVRHGRLRDYLWAGAWIGFAIACKVSAAPLVVPLIVAHAYRGSERTDGYAEGAGATDVSWWPVAAPQSRRPLPANPLLLVGALLTTVVAVFATMPYAFIDFTSWWSDVYYQLQLAQGIQEQAFTRKFSGLPSYYYPLQQLVGWTMGLPLGLSAVAGTLVAVGRQVRRRHGSELVLLSWAVVFFASAGGQYMKFLRYMLPLAPVLTLFAAALLVALWRWASAPRAERLPRLKLSRVYAPLLVMLVVGLTVCYGLAHETVYTAENTRLAATRWMATNIPAGATITTEGPWDEALPYGSPPGVSVPAYQTIPMDILGPGDGPTTVPMFVNALQNAQYITISSARVFGSVAHQPGRYPYSIRWYELLFGGRLNFKLVKSFIASPQLGPIKISDTQSVPRANQYTGTHLWYEADQNLSEYDHPPVYIFKRGGPISPARATALLTDNGRLRPQVAAFDPSHPMTLPAAVDKANQTAPTYAQVFPANGLLAQFPLLGWLLMVELLGLLALPLVLRVCGRLLRDGGYALTKLCGILIVGYLTWLAASLHVAVYSRGLILVSCAVLLVLSLALGLRPRALWATIKERGRGIILAELVFLAAFLAFAAIRAAYPDLWHTNYGGERTQELSFTNAILRSQYFPPADPWFAGGTLNYYYYGQFLTGMLMKLSGIAVPISFNLALPTLYALMLSITFSIGYSATGRAWVGAAAMALEGVLGNLGMVWQFATLDPSCASGSIPLLSGVRSAVSCMGAVLTHQNGLQLRGDFFWASSRILSTPNDGVINEYPIWSFTYGDMHAHVIDIPILLGVITLALAISGLGSPHPRLPSPAHGRGAGGEGSRRFLPRALGLLPFGVLAAVIAGATGPTNLWDLPTSLAILTAGFGLRGWFVAGRRGWALALRDIALPGGLLGLACLVLYRPFYSTVLGISSGFTFIQPHAPTDAYLLHLGLPLFLLTSFMVVFLLRQTRPLYWLERAMTVMEFRGYYRDQAARLPRVMRLAGAMRRRSGRSDAPPALLTPHLLILGAALTVGLLLVGFTTLGLIAALLTLATMALAEACARWRSVDPVQSQPFGLVMAVMGLALTALPDIVVQIEAGHMNTFFKLYNAAWPLLAIAGALSLSALVPRRRAAPARAEARVPSAATARRASTPLLASPFTRQLSLSPASVTAGVGPGQGSRRLVAASTMSRAWSTRSDGADSEPERYHQPEASGQRGEPEAEVEVAQSSEPIHAPGEAVEAPGTLLAAPGPLPASDPASVQPIESAPQSHSQPVESETEQPAEREYTSRPATTPTDIGMGMEQPPAPVVEATEEIPHAMSHIATSAGAMDTEGAPIDNRHEVEPANAPGAMPPPEEIGRRAYVADMGQWGMRVRSESERPAASMAPSDNVPPTQQDRDEMAGSPATQQESEPAEVAIVQPVEAPAREGDHIVESLVAPAVTVAAAPPIVPAPRQAPRRSIGLADGAWVIGGLWWAVLVLLVAGGALFPIVGISNHLQIRSIWPRAAAAKIPTGLDGAAFARVLYPADYAAIGWINGHIHGMPVLLTSDRGYYTDFAADQVPMFTGLPTIATWPGEDGQERYSGQQRPASKFPSNWINDLDSGRVTWSHGRWVTNLPQAGAPTAGLRVTDVETIYNTPDPAVALPLLHQYHVGYIYVGTAERGDPNYSSDVGFDPTGLAKFDRMAAARQLRVVYNRLGVTIYKVVA